MDSWIYKSSRKQDMYLYLAAEDDFDNLPEGLLEHFGTPSLVMQLVLSNERKLAREDINKVIGNLQTLGYHLQMPVDLKPDMYHGNED